jgi:hypothetical protein
VGLGSVLPQARRDPRKKSLTGRIERFIQRERAMLRFHTPQPSLPNTTSRSWQAVVCAATTEDKQGIYLPLSREKGAKGG